MLSRMLVIFAWTFLVLIIFESTGASPVRETEEWPKMDPDEETGLRVAQWTKESNVNPEELGSYFEGDIMLTNGIDRNGIIGENYHWQNCEIPYIITGNFNKDQRKHITTAMNRITQLTCIKFTPRENQKDYIDIKSDTSGCWSNVGRIGNKQTVNLQIPGCVQISGTPMHEFMHTIGFWHEQSRKNRDSYIEINRSNIKRGAERNFVKKENTNDYGAPYDYNSIMHYGAYAFAKDPKVKTIITTNPRGAKIGQRDDYSASDIKKIKSMYKDYCKC